MDTWCCNNIQLIKRINERKFSQIVNDKLDLKSFPLNVRITERIVIIFVQYFMIFIEIKFRWNLNNNITTMQGFSFS